MIRRLSYAVLATTLAILALAGCSRQTAEEKGKALATEKIDLVKGVGEALKEKGGQAAESVAQGTGGVLQGVGEGFGKAFEWKLTNGAGMEKSGLTATRVDKGSSPEGNKNAVNAYLVATREATGTLLMIAYDSRQRETGRAQVAMRIGANEGHYETLLLDERTPINAIREVTFDFLPGEAATAASK